MDWDRRAFTKFAVGAIVGLHASPLVPKLMDDSAIWTQNWNWVPDPEEGELVFANSFNPSTGSAVKVRIINARMSGERFIRVEGNPEHPIGKGGVVPEDVAALQLLYYRKLRVLTPLLRESKSGVRRPVSWEKAIAYLAGRLGGLKDKKTMAACYGTDDDTTAELLKVFMAAYGSPNLCFHPTAKNTLARAAGTVFGNSGVGFDLENSDYIVSLGTPLLEGFGAPLATRKAFTALKDKKGGLVSVEPRASVTAGLSDIWLSCKPGTEGVVALGLAHLVVQSGGNAEGDFEDFLLGKFGPEKVEALTGVPRAKLKEVVRGLKAARAPVAVCGPSDAGDPGNQWTFMAVLALNATLGNLGKPGGVVARQPLPLQPLAKTTPGATILPQELLKQKLDTLLLSGINPAYAAPGAGKMRKFLEDIPFIVAISEYMDETAAMADLVLPVGSFLETWGDASSPYGAGRSSYGLHKPLFMVNKEAKAVGDWLLALAAMMGGNIKAAMPWENMKKALAARVEGMGGIEDLAKKTFWVQEKTAYGAVGSFTPHLGDGFPAAETDKGHPLLMAAIPSLRTGSGIRPMAPYQTKILSDSTLVHKDQLVVEINPQTAEKHHIKEGDSVTIASQSGEIAAVAHFNIGAAPDMVFVPLGLGRTAFGQYLNGRGGNFFEAAVLGTDPLSGFPQWSLTLVSLGKGGVSHV